MTSSEPVPQLIAHRGYSACYPENTLAGLEAALQAGADCIEIDVQFSKDLVPVVIHDIHLIRTTGVEGKVNKLSAAQITHLCAGERQRFADHYPDAFVPTLDAVLALLEQWPDATLFVELKHESVESFGPELLVQKLVAKLKYLGERSVLISSHAEVPVYARKSGMKRTGWVVSSWNKQSQSIARAVSPDVLFCNYQKIPDADGVLWAGPWQWALYDLVDPQLALRWIDRGVMYVETWDIGRLLGDQSLVSRLGKKPKKT